MKNNYLFRIGFLLMSFLWIGSYAQVTTTFDYTGAVQTYIVPPGVTSIQVECWGGQAEATTPDDFAPFSTGGLGGYVIGNLAVTPGETLNIYVGGQGTSGSGGFNGGGTGGYGTGSTHSSGYAGSGGGASDVRQGGTALTDRVIVAGGGGGGGRNYTNGGCVPCGTGGNGGAGGGIVGTDGDDPGGGVYDHFNVGAGGSGGTDLAGGAGGDGTEGTSGNPGVLGVGGEGIDGTQGVASGGGGGGYYGGGAGGGVDWGSGAAGGGAGGGSSYIGGVTDASTTAGIRTGNGQIIITELCTPLSMEVSSDEICFGEELTLTGTSDLGGTISWDDPDITNGEPFIPTETGEVEYTASSDDDGDCPYTVTVIVNALPEVTAEVDESEICLGESVIFTSGGTADEYEWTDGIEDDVEYTPEAAGDFDFTLYGTDDETGCMDSVVVSISVYEIPEVAANSDDVSYCEGDEIILTGSGADTYEWDMGVEDGVAFTQPIGSVTYTVIGTSDEGCEAMDFITITVNQNPEITLVGSDELFGDDGSIDLTVDAGLAPFQYDWDNDGTGDFDDPDDLDDIPGGTYTVVMIDANGCMVTGEITIDSQLSIDAENVNLLSVYPNPTEDQLTLQMEGQFSYQLVAVSGDIILSGSSVNQEMIDVSNLASGVYFVQVMTQGQKHTVKVIKK